MGKCTGETYVHVLHHKRTSDMDIHTYVHSPIEILTHIWVKLTSKRIFGLVLPSKKPFFFLILNKSFFFTISFLVDQFLKIAIVFSIPS